MHVNYLSYNKAMYFFGFVRNLDNFVTGFVMSFYANLLIPNEKSQVYSSLWRFWTRNFKWIRCLLYSQRLWWRQFFPTNPDTFPHLIIRVSSKAKMELSLSWIYGALATTKERTAKTSQAIKRMRVFFFVTFFTCIPAPLKCQMKVNFPAKSWGRHPSLDWEENKFVPVFTFFKHRRQS